MQWWKKKKVGVGSVWGPCRVDVGSMYGRCGRGWKLKIKSKIKKRENKSIEEEYEGCGVSKTLYFVLKRASLSLPSLICTICPPKISEPELGQSQQQEIGQELVCLCPHEYTRFARQKSVNRNKDNHSSRKQEVHNYVTSQ